MTEPRKPEEEEPTISLAWAASLGYGVLICVAVFWFWVRDRGYRLPELAVGEHLGLSLVVGAGVGLGISGIFWSLSRYLAPFAALEERLAELVGELTESEILVIAMTSAVGEEMLFRGAVQDHFGVIVAALVFGLLHVGPGLWLWTGLATAMGFLFGWMVESGCGLLSASVAHALINYLSLRRMSLPRRAET